jgi:transcriptional regulator
MYVPTAFRQTDRAELFEFIKDHSSGLLISRLAGEPYATHLPLVVHEGAGPTGRLLGHVARANPQWHELDGQQVLVAFSGPHAYVSPTWYESHDVVPTWNYVAVHVYGRCQLVDDEQVVAGILAEFVATYERRMPAPWTPDLDSPSFRKLARAVVGFQISITSLEGKWKLGQNHPAERRRKVARRLEASNDPSSQAIARLMSKTL